jgi:NAD+ kinase
VLYLKNILVLPNPVKPEAVELTGKLVSLLSELDFAPVLEIELADQSGFRSFGKEETKIWDNLDLVMVLGGDGSMLNAARKVFPREIPLLGVNLGHLGFLTRVESNNLESALINLKNGNYQLEERAMLEGEVIRNGRTVSKVVGLNELVLTRNAFAKMVRLETWIDEEYFTTYPADGLIVATATGSTAYSLSAGGPILDPRLKGILVTPICAHSLYARPLVLSENAQVKVCVNASRTEVSLTADGQDGVELEPGDCVYFRRIPTVTKLLRFNGQGLFEVLKSRLKEGRI